MSNIRTSSGSTRSLTVLGNECGVAWLWRGIHVRLIYCLFSLTAAGSPTNINAIQVNLTSFSVSCDWIPGVLEWRQRVWQWQFECWGWWKNSSYHWSYPWSHNITIVALSDHLPSAVVGAVMVTLGETQILKRGGGQLLCHSCCHKHHSQLQHVLKWWILNILLVQWWERLSAQLYTVILLVSICWNKRHR